MSPRLYVGTYHKYNSGSIGGAWLDLDELSDKQTFLQACAELHKDEPDPEFMFQDYEGFPKELYSEGYLKPELFEWCALDPDDRLLLEAYHECGDGSADIETARDAYMGCATTKEAWAEEYLTDSGELASVPEHLRDYIDFERYARDAEHNGISFVRLGGTLYVFNNQ